MIPISLVENPDPSEESPLRTDHRYLAPLSFRDVGTGGHPRLALWESLIRELGWAWVVHLMVGLGVLVLWALLLVILFRWRLFRGCQIWREWAGSSLLPVLQVAEVQKSPAIDFRLFLHNCMSEPNLINSF